LLAALVCDDDWGVRWQVAERLDARQHAALLQRLTQDEDPEVRAMAHSRFAPIPFVAGAPHGGHRP
jgi:hypothetical protein